MTSRLDAKDPATVSHSPLSADIAAMIKSIDGLEPQRGPIRFVVATDWSAAAIPLTALRAFRAIVPPSTDVQLVFAVPHEPTEGDAACVAELLAGLGGPEDLRGLELLSFAQVSAEDYDTALVPTGDVELLITQVGGFVTRLHDVVRRLDGAADGSDPGQLNAGDQDALRGRLAQFRA